MYVNATVRLGEPANERRRLVIVREGFKVSGTNWTKKKEHRGSVLSTVYSGLRTLADGSINVSQLAPYCF